MVNFGTPLFQTDATRVWSPLPATFSQLSLRSRSILIWLTFRSVGHRISKRAPQLDPNFALLRVGSSDACVRASTNGAWIKRSSFVHTST